jgi:hypothetical protein
MYKIVRFFFLVGNSITTTQKTDNKLEDHWMLEIDVVIFHYPTLYKSFQYKLGFVEINHNTTRNSSFPHDQL